MTDNKNYFIDPTRSESYPSVNLTNFSGISTYEIFNKLTFWNQIDYLKNSVDIPLLQEIQEKSPSKQFKTLATFRLCKLNP